MLTYYHVILAILDHVVVKIEALILIVYLHLLISGIDPTIDSDIMSQFSIRQVRSYIKCHKL